MPENRLLLCTDMDRTIIPNGPQPEPRGARAAFAAFCARPDVTLAYVTGRHPALVQQAITEYALPTPAYAITDVGATIYRINGETWIEQTDWSRRIGTDWQGRSAHDILPELDGIPDLTPQEPEKQQPRKASFYIVANTDIDAVLRTIHARLDAMGLAARCICSIDETSGTGLLDVLPRQAGKCQAILFLQNMLAMTDEQVIFAGDSGNDLDVLRSPVQSILVGNATADLRNTACADAPPALYCANACYAAGVLEGVRYWAGDDAVDK
jgi:sucrose-6-phosphatase